MGCDFPIPAYRSPEVGPSGKRLLTFNPVKSVRSDTSIGIPCGQCRGCRLDRARDWAIRISHEAKSYEHNQFVTLTFRNEHLPPTGSISKRDVQLFVKRLRKHFPGRTLRYFACGEYGGKLGRPHYHLVIFNLELPDLVRLKWTSYGWLYRSATLEKLWPFGFVTTGSVNFNSAGYVARYSLKKITGDKAAAHYEKIDPTTGEVYQLEPEFRLCSLKPCIGEAHALAHKSDFFPSGYLVHRGRKIPVPRAYKRTLTEEEQEQLKRDAKRAALPHKSDQTMARRIVKAQVRDARIKALKRTLENDA